MTTMGMAPDRRITAMGGDITIRDPMDLDRMAKFMEIRAETTGFEAIRIAPNLQGIIKVMHGDGGTNGIVHNFRWAE